MVSMWLEGHEQDGERLQRALALTSIRRSCHDLRPFGRPCRPLLRPAALCVPDTRLIGWVERNDAHRIRRKRMALALLEPSDKM